MEQKHKNQRSHQHGKGPLGLWAHAPFWIAALALFGGCSAMPDEPTMRAMVTFGLDHPGKEFCLPNENEAVADLLRDASFDCMAVQAGDPTADDDSVLILVRRKLSEVEYLYYDFARRERVLETWDNDGDRRQNIGERLYQRQLSLE